MKKNWKKSVVVKMNSSSFAPVLSLRGRRLVPHGDRPRPLAPGGPQGADGGDGRGHAGPLRQLGLGQQLPAALQRHGPGLEAVPARGRRRGKVPHQVLRNIGCGFSQLFSKISQDVLSAPEPVRQKVLFSRTTKAQTNNWNSKATFKSDHKLPKTKGIIIPII